MRSAPLGGVRVLDLTESTGGYAGRLLCDLGANVRRAAPAVEDGDSPQQFLWNRGKSTFRVDSRPVKHSDVAELLTDTDILITDAGPAALSRRGLHPAVTTAQQPSLIHLSITPYGLTGARADHPASDLTLLADGGLLYLCGDADRDPVRPFGEQSTIAASLHGTLAGLMALLVAEETGQGQIVDVSAQEAVAQSIENAVQYLDCEGQVRRRNGAGPAEAGAGLFRCADGYVYVLTWMGGADLCWPQLCEWVIASGVDSAVSLHDNKWRSAEYRASPEGRREFRDLFEEFASAQTKAELYSEGQRRAISIAPVSDPKDLLANEQLLSRDYFREAVFRGRQVLVPGPPYRFDGMNLGSADEECTRTDEMESVDG